MREVVSQCIYAVDKNPMAVELCKVALWIEAIELGKLSTPTSVACTVGIFEPKVLEDGILIRLTGRSRATTTVCSSSKRERRVSQTMQRGGLQGSLDHLPSQRVASQQQLEAIQAMPDGFLLSVQPNSGL